MRVGITGHRGLTGQSASLVKAAILDTVTTFPAEELIGVSCIADGPDAWFAEAILEHGGHLEVVIPSEDYRDALPEWHHLTYDALLNRASEVHATGLAHSNSQAHMTGSEILVGLVDQVIAVWDGQPARGYGGTADVVRYAESNGVTVQILWPAGATRD
ncbi:hypothetical protein [Streptomyces sp. CBMA29]|uniref:hypothetical protein n=1 Tax=Streptomyces sp. CBMA29 TaxID=1896314 RepID=UPI00166197C5|nr:hypothetical protein [Streptomyces sp. CBMA29]MBD0738189.1 hypothetical protein [Streptomyces sp. CBMA29]